VTVLGTVVAAVLAAAGPAPATGSSYVSVGDSMTAPGATYPSFVARTLGARTPSLRVSRLGCAGITAREVAGGGGPCDYPEGSQLAAAEAALRARRGRVDLVTLTIGGNDMLECTAVADLGCLRQRLPALRSDLRAITRRLRAAAGRGTTLIGTTYHDPYLGYWTQARRADARASVPVVTEFNRALTAVYRSQGWRIADVGADFRITDFRVPRGARLPRNVAMTCRYTLACPEDPAAFDVHPNRIGYERIGRLVVRTRGATGR
jgi:lysophospholipase L1-like esterase